VPPGPRAEPDRRRSVVYLERAPQEAFAESRPGRVVLDQRGEAFLPYVLAVGVGTTVDFKNSDVTYHNVFSLSKPKRFDLGRYARGGSKSVVFDKPGVVRVFCDIHSHMNAWVLVFAHRFFAATNEHGAYRIDGLPPGSYSLVVWTDGQVRETRPFQVAADDAALVEDFVVDR
jgi:plastocyanin